MNDDNFRKQFEDHLVMKLGVSKNTLKFYKSDLNHFIKWFSHQMRTTGYVFFKLQEAVINLNPGWVEEYKESLESPHKTINRRLSTLRHFARFLLDNSYLHFNFMEGVVNVGVTKKVEVPREAILIEQFEEYLRHEKISSNSIKNYLSDVRHFMGWLEGSR